jgi:hypothetical protein
MARHTVAVAPVSMVAPALVPVSMMAPAMAPAVHAVMAEAGPRPQQNRKEPLLVVVERRPERLHGIRKRRQALGVLGLALGPLIEALGEVGAFLSVGLAVLAEGLQAVETLLRQGLEGLLDRSPELQLIGTELQPGRDAGETRRAERLKIRPAEALVPHHSVALPCPVPVLLRLLVLSRGRLRRSGRRLGEGSRAGEGEHRGRCEGDELCHGHLL